MIETTMERYRRARTFFDAKDYVTASTMLAELVAENPDELALRLLLARAYYHSAQLARAEDELRAILHRNPVEEYARMLLGRTLQRQSRHREAEPHLRLADAMAGDEVAAGWRPR